MREALTSLLLAHDPLTDLVGDRVHWGRLPPEVIGRPYVALWVISGPLQYHFEGETDLRQWVVQADIWGESPASVAAVAEALRGRLSAYRGAHGGVEFQAVFLTADRDSDSTSAGDERVLYRRSLDFNINWKGA